MIYGHLGGSKDISAINKRFPSASPSPRTDVAAEALSYYVEAGYDLLSLFASPRRRDSRLYLYGHYGFCDSMYRTAEGVTDKAWCERTILSAGINYFPVRGVVIKAEYSLRKLASGFNDEPGFSLGVGYSGLLN